MTVTATAHPNIALIKYWGKRDTAKNLPAVSSLSLTLDTFATTTTISIADTDTVMLNGEPASPDFARRVFQFLDHVQQDRPPCAVHTTNNFPTAAGLASSASGFAALALASAQLLCDPTPSRTHISRLARLGSGSATRSLYGGFVRWHKGNAADGSDSIAQQVAAQSHWPTLRMVVAVVSDQEKAIGSTVAMERSRTTSPMYQSWVDGAEDDVVNAQTAIMACDLDTLGTLMESSTMKMYATMTTAAPPILYWKPQTVAVLHAIWALREQGISAWCTMDAGPNVKILCAEDDAEIVAFSIKDFVLATHTLKAGADARLSRP